VRDDVGCLLLVPWFGVGSRCVRDGFVRLALPASGDELPGDRFAGGAVPLLPFLGAVGLPVGVQE
jgi:hypothetical protein